MKRILIMAGGTGGHIFPALVVARALTQNGIEVEWLGTSGLLEQEIVSPEFKLHPLQMRGLRRKSVLQKLCIPWHLLCSILRSMRIIYRFKPNVIIGMGGYVAAPGGIAAWLMRVPLIIHEQNSIAGFTNRSLAKIACTVLQAFPKTFPQKPNVKTTGNPVRQELLQVPQPRERFGGRMGPLRILILGGSQGAKAINETVLSMLQGYEHLEQLEIQHQTGRNHFASVNAAYRHLTVVAKVYPFIDDVLSAYCWADLVICRAGALTVTEIAAVGVASIFVPYPYAVDNHQLHNSRFLEQVGAAVIVPQQQFTPEKLTHLLQELLNNRDRLVAMAECAREMVRPNATEQVIAECEKYYDIG